MLNYSGMLAAVDYINPITNPDDSAPRILFKDILITFGALLGAALLLTSIAIFLRRKKIRRQGNLSRSAWPASASKNQKPAGTLRRNDGQHRHERHRHRRREHRPRNPTLADTGGLPPKRPDDQPPKSV